MALTLAFHSELECRSQSWCSLFRWWQRLHAKLSRDLSATLSAQETGDRSQSWSLTNSLQNRLSFFANRFKYFLCGIYMYAYMYGNWGISRTTAFEVSSCTIWMDLLQVVVFSASGEGLRLRLRLIHYFCITGNFGVCYPLHKEKAFYSKNGEDFSFPHNQTSQSFNCVIMYN